MFDDILGPDKVRSIKKSVKARLKKYYEQEKSEVESSGDEQCKSEDRGACTTNGNFKILWPKKLTRV